MENIKFKVTSTCGDYQIGDFVEAFLLCREGDIGFIYVPKGSKMDYGCIIPCSKYNSMCDKCGTPHTYWEELEDGKFINLRMSCFNKE